MADRRNARFAKGRPAAAGARLHRVVLQPHIQTDGAILVVQYRKYPRDMLVKAKQMIETLGVNMVGAVLNNINVMRDDYYYYYHSDYTEYSDYQTSFQDESVTDKSA